MTVLAVTALAATGLATTGLLVAAIVSVALAVAVFGRVVLGPTTPDRVVAVNVIGTTTVIVISLLAAALGEPGFLDVALVYALLNFLLSVGLAKFSIERGGVL